MATAQQVARSIITPWSTSIKPTWTISQVRAALYSHRTGDLQAISQLFDSLLEDDELPGTLDKRIQSTLRSEFSLKIDEDRELSEDEKALQALFPEIAPDDELWDIIASYLLIGAGVGTIDWDTTQVPWVPTVRALPTEYLRYDEHRRLWEYEAREGTQVVTPGDGKWILFTAGQRGFIRGLIRGLAVLWLGKQMTLGDWQRYCQKHGLPIIKASVPLFSHEDEKEGFLDDLSAIQSEGVIGLPKDAEGNGYDVELLEATDQSWMGFKENVARADRKIQCMLLGSNIGSEQTAATGGSRSAAETSVKGVDRDKGRADSKAIGQMLKEQLVRPYVNLNLGEGVAVPLPFWDTCPEDDSAARGEAQNNFVEMLGKLPAAGYELENVAELAAEFGMDLKPSEKGPMVDRDPVEAPTAPAEKKEGL